MQLVTHRTEKELLNLLCSLWNTLNSNAILPDVRGTVVEETLLILNISQSELGHVRGPKSDWTTITKAV